MYGSNFPVDKGSYGYGIGLNALKRLTGKATPSEKADIFWRSAKTFYRLSDASLRIANLGPRSEHLPVGRRKPGETSVERQSER
jgi:hypothetical protein